MLWKDISSVGDVDQIIEASANDGSIHFIFKHSTRCSISLMAKSRLESGWKFGQTYPTHYLDVLQHRNSSNYVASIFNVEHESPQLLIVKNGKCIHNSSHMEISVNNIENFLEKEI